MELLRDRRIDCASGRRGRWPWIVAIVAVILAAIAPARIAAQEEEMPTPMATPEMMMLPKVALFAYPNYGMAPMTVGFIPQIHDLGNSDIVSYRWVFGNGQVATTPPLVTYTIYKDPGVYVASLTIVTEDGRSATGFASVTVKASGG
jgi:PKD repeat protein